MYFSKSGCSFADVVRQSIAVRVSDRSVELPDNGLYACAEVKANCKPATVTNSRLRWHQTYR